MRSHGHQLGHPGYGRGAVALNDVDLFTPQELRKRLIAVFRDPAYVAPVLPRVAIELLEITRRTDVEVREIVSLLEQDALIAAGVLKKAQSAYYSRGAPVRSLNEAIVRLGLDSVRDLFLAAAVSARVFRAPGYDEPMERLRRHSMATAYVARLVCRQTAIYDEYAFLCGLLHDAGIVASLIALASNRPKGQKPPPIEEAWQAVCEAHVEAGEMLSKLWKLPDEITYVIGCHHNPRPGQPAHPLAAAIAVAESITAALGFGVDGDGSGVARWAIDALGLSEPVLASITTQATELVPRFE